MASIPTENFTAINALLEKDILPVIPYQRYQRAPLYKMFGGFEPTNDQQSFYKENRFIEQGTQGTKMQNNILYFDIITDQTGAAGAMSTDLQVVYGSVPLLQGQVNLARQATAFTMGEDVLLSPGVVKNTFALTCEQAVNAHALDGARQLYSDGTSALGTANATQSTPSTTFVFAASTNGDIDYAQFVGGNAQGGTIIQIGTNAPVQITGVTGVNTVTIATAQTWTSGNTVYKVTAGGVVGGVEYVGLNGIIGSGSYASISDPSWISTTQTSFGSFASNGGAGALDSNWIKTTKTGNPSTCVMNGTVFSSYGNGLTSQKQFNYMDPLYAGWPQLQLMGQNGTVLLDWYCPDDHIYILSPESLWFAYLEDIHWLGGTQGILNRIPGSANFEATATMYAAAFCNLRSGNSFMSGVTA